MSILAGMTGPTGSGKSSAAATARSAGIKVIDCDLLAREAVLPGTPGLDALVGAFGKKVLNTDGTLNRKAMAAAAFCDREHTELLNRTLLPHIILLVEKQIDGQRVLLDAPTLFESGLDRICDTTLAVLADNDIRISRIIARDGLTLNEAKLRISAGKPDEFYRCRAAYILYNNGDKEAFEKDAAAVFGNIFSR